MFQRNEIIQSMLSGHNRLGSKTTMKKKKRGNPQMFGNEAMHF